MAALYLVVAWLVLQVTDVVTSVLVLPVWVGQIVFLMLALGFPVALVMAWAFELTPEGVRRDSPGAEYARPGDRGRHPLDWLTLGLLLVALGWFAWHHDWNGPKQPAASPDIRSLVVLPLENLMNDPQQAYFVGGMHEALITELSRIEALHVISRTSALALEDSGLSVPEIGQALGVDALIEGSVLRAGDTVRITVQLIEADTDRNLWADNFDRPLEDILALYGEVTREIAQQVRVKLTPDQEAQIAGTRPVNPEVYELYLEGRFLCDKWSPAEMELGIQRLREAVARDPAHAPAHAQLALCLQYSAFFGYLKPLDVNNAAREIAETAVRLDPGLADGWVALAGVQQYLDLQPRIALESLQKALAVEPNNVRALMHLSWLNGEAGRFTKAYEYNNRALRLDPLSVPVINAMGQVHYLNRDYEAALESYRRALDLERSDPSMHYYVARTLEQMGRYGPAIESHRMAVRLSGGEPLYLAALAYCLAVSGDTAGAQEILEDLEASDQASPYDLAIAHLGLGQYDLAVAGLAQAYTVRDSHIAYLNRDERFDPLRQAPVFQGLLEALDYPSPDKPLSPNF